MKLLCKLVFAGLLALALITVPGTVPAENYQVPDEVMRGAGYIALAPASWAHPGVAKAGGRLAFWWVPVSQDLVMKGVVDPIANVQSKPLSSVAKMLTWPLWFGANGLVSLGNVGLNAYGDVAK